MMFEFYVALAVGVALFVGLMSWIRFRSIERRMRKLRDDVEDLQKQESRRFVMTLNADPKADAVRSENRLVEPARGEVVSITQSSGAARSQI